MKSESIFIKNRWTVLFVLLCTSSLPTLSQNNPVRDSIQNDSLRQVAEALLLQQRQQHQSDSVAKLELQKELEDARGDKLKTRELQSKLNLIAKNDSIRKAQQLQNIAELKKNARGYPVAPFGDTLFYIYTKIGSFTSADRANAVSQRIKIIYQDPFYNGDSISLNETENGFDILYKNERLILSVNSLDALWFGTDTKQLATKYISQIKNAVDAEKKENSLNNWLKRIGLAALIVLGLYLLIFFMNRLYRRVKYVLIVKNKHKYLSGLTIRKIKILTAEQLQQAVLRTINILRIVLVVLAVYFSLPLLFSIFPETENWTNTLLNWILTPAKTAGSSLIHFLPNLFTILVIYFIFRYGIKAIKYFVNEIGKGNIHLSGFHPDWAQPTFNIIKFVLYAFMIVVMFPYLPGSGSAAFKGVSVFLGVIFSLGSSSAISNMVAGLVITYMRPFKIGDRIKIGDVTGDVMEKTMLVTRIRTIKNEDVTLPNSNVLSGSTINYSSNASPEDKGVILHTTVTIGYDVPWKEMHQALINAALRTEMILKEPAPFVLQTSLDDFYVSYEINGYTRDPNKQAVIYSRLHQNIQDCCSEAGIEILSPHFRQLRDGNMTTIPKEYLDKNYKPGSFKVKQVNDEL